MEKTEIQKLINDCYRLSVQVYDLTDRILNDPLDSIASKEMTDIVIKVMDTSGDIERHTSAYCADHPDEAVELYTRVNMARLALLNALNWSSMKALSIKTKTQSKEIDLALDLLDGLYSKRTGQC